MDSLISTFHIDWKILLAQIVNFGIIFLVLYKFAFGPIAKILRERADTIDKSLKEAKEIETKLAATEQDRIIAINEAKKEAALLMEKAQVMALANKKQLIEKTKAEVAQIVANEKASIVIERETALKELKKDLADLVMAATAKIIDEKMTGAKDKELIEKVLK